VASRGVQAHQGGGLGLWRADGERLSGRVETDDACGEVATPLSAGNAAIFFVWDRRSAPCSSWRNSCRPGSAMGPLLAGLGLMPWGATTVIVPRITRALINRLGERPFIVAGMSLHALGVSWIAFIAEPGLAYWQLVAPLIVSGAGVAIAIPATQSSVLS
jgi:hypothetical protein